VSRFFFFSNKVGNILVSGVTIELEEKTGFMKLLKEL